MPLYQTLYREFRKLIAQTPIHFDQGPHEAGTWRTSYHEEMTGVGPELIGRPGAMSQEPHAAWLKSCGQVPNWDGYFSPKTSTASHVYTQAGGGHGHNDETTTSPRTVALLEHSECLYRDFIFEPYIKR